VPPPAPLPPLPPAAPGDEVRALVTGTGVVVPVLARRGGALLVRTPCAREAVVAGGTPLFGATVVLDPGHGGVERGAVGVNGLTEAAVNLAVAELTRDLLEAAGATVVLTRTADYRVALGPRAEIATNLQPRAFVSIHHNAEADGPAPRPGTETYFQIASPESRRLAGILYEELVATFSRFEGVPWQADTDAGAKYRPNARGGDYYGILRRSAGVPAVLSEALFLSNPAEAALLARPEVQRAEAEAIARAVARFLTSDDPGSGFVEPYPRTERAGPGGGTQGCEDPPLE
ncbi:MAG: N-acetylmuramoyl-L-alanine amidase, partial [Actinomycetota bacterium]|nr:N-acetylmuramoyl-L-alanine amidase [Actinomycetota bacterium]